MSTENTSNTTPLRQEEMLTTRLTIKIECYLNLETGILGLRLFCKLCHELKKCEEGGGGSGGGGGEGKGETKGEGMEGEELRELLTKSLRELAGMWIDPSLKIFMSHLNLH